MVNQIEGGERIEESELLSCCPPTVRTSLRAAGRSRHYEKGAIVFMEGDPAASVLIIKTGSVAWFRENADGRRLIVKLAGPGQSCGLPSVVMGSPRLVGVEALEPLHVLEVPASAILGVMSADAAMATRIARIALEDYERLLDFAMEVTFHPVSHRILRLILQLQHEQGLRYVTLRHADFAALAGTTRETFTAQLGALERAGLVARSGRKIHIKNPSLAQTIMHNA
jgi:CRP-like cAMP-binding protein